MNPELKRLLIEHGITRSKQQSYTMIKNLVDELFMENTHKCVEDVCGLSLKASEELSSQDIQELTDVAEDLCYYIGQARIMGLSNSILEKIRHYFNHAYYTLEFQGDLAPIGLVMGRFNQLIEDYRDSLIGLDDNQIELVAGFANDFKRWVDITYRTHGVTNGLENSIISGFDQIKAMVEPANEDDEVEFFHMSQEEFKEFDLLVSDTEHKLQIRDDYIAYLEYQVKKLQGRLNILLEITKG